MIRIETIVIANGELSDPIPCNRIIEKHLLKRFKSLLQTLIRAKLKQKIDVLLIYTDLNKASK